MDAKASTESKFGQSDGFHFGELLKVLRLRRKFIYAFTILAVFGALFRQVFYVPLYGAQTKLSVQKIESSPMQMALANFGAMSLDTSDKLKRYIDYLQSSEFFLAVAETIKFQDSYNILNLNSPDEMSITHKKFWQRFLATHFGHQISGNPGEIAGSSEPVLVPIEKLAGILAGMTQSEGLGNDTIRIRVTSLDPVTSMVLVNTIAEVFVRKTSERDYNEVTEVKKFIQEQLESTTERLKLSESSLIEFKKRHNLISSKSESGAFGDKMGTIENDLEEQKLKFQENQRLIEYYDNALGKQEKRILTQGASAIQRSPTELITRLRQQMDTLRYKKVLMQAQGYADNSWQMTEINKEIDKVAGMLKTELGGSAATDTGDDDDLVLSGDASRSKLLSLKNENKTLELKISTLEHSRASLLKNLESMPKEEQYLFTLSRDVDLQFELYSSLKKKLQEVEIQQIALQSHVNISERSGLPPPVPRTNIIVKILFALLIGIFLGGSTAFLIEAVDPTVKHPFDLERMELLMLGTVPHVLGSPMREGLGGRSYRPTS